jgi:heme-degrading monooxygenase HmoA
MIAAIYQFDVKPGQDKVFIESWKFLTESIYEHRGSLGSRLHKNGDGTYVAYAQWPSARQFELETPLPESSTEVKKTLKESCINIRLIYQAEVVADLLKKGSFR